MLARQGLRSGVRVWATAHPTLTRAYADAAKREKVPTAEAQVSDQFKSDWKKIAPNFDLPKFPSNFMAARPPVPSTIPTKLTVNFVLPYVYEVQSKPVSAHILSFNGGYISV